MAPNNTASIEESVSPTNKTEQKTDPEYKKEVVYTNVLLFIYLHLSFVYGVYLGLTTADPKTGIFSYIYGNIAGLGITAGAHRLWSHRSYKARLPLRIFLVILNSVAAQNDVYEWCRDHRVHHKFTETDADPHNIKRGFFFAHMGWLMCKKHPAVKAKGKTVYLDDLLADPVVRFQRKFYIPLVLLFSFYLPTMIPVWLWNETVWNSFFVSSMARYCFSLNVTWLVNSAAHMFGDRPYDRFIWASESPFVAFFAHGEGWHNYHHVFPWDYSTSELGYSLNLTKVFIDFMALIGQAYDLKTAHPQLVKNRKLKTGDGTRIKDLKMSSSEYCATS